LHFLQALVHVSHAVPFSFLNAEHKSADDGVEIESVAADDHLRPGVYPEDSFVMHKQNIPEQTYHFAYVAPGHSHQQQKQGGVVTGSYSMMTPDKGEYTVRYRADKTGFHIVGRDPVSRPHKEVQVVTDDVDSDLLVEDQSRFYPADGTVLKPEQGAYPQFLSQSESSMTKEKSQQYQTQYKDEINTGVPQQHYGGLNCRKKEPWGNKCAISLYSAVVISGAARYPNNAYPIIQAAPYYSGALNQIYSVPPYIFVAGGAEGQSHTTADEDKVHMTPAENKFKQV
jgi:hypothetical protein